MAKVEVQHNHSHKKPISDVAFQQDGLRFITWAWGASEMSHRSENMVKLWVSATTKSAEQRPAQTPLIQHFGVDAVVARGR